jgi:hypothetical protein
MRPADRLLVPPAPADDRGNWVYAARELGAAIIFSRAYGEAGNMEDA